LINERVKILTFAFKLTTINLVAPQVDLFKRHPAPKAGALVLKNAYNPFKLRNFNWLPLSPNSRY
jgi:hypothetical protein